MRAAKQLATGPVIRDNDMKLLLRKNVNKLGIVGDIVDVADGFGRNYLLPQGLATEPTASNIRALAEARKQAEFEREQFLASLRDQAEKLSDIEISLYARANDEGVLYGSVGRREIAAALREQGFSVDPEHVVLKDPIRRLDKVKVEVRMTADTSAEINVWVHREKTGDESEDELGKEGDEAIEAASAPEDGAEGEETAAETAASAESEARTEAGSDEQGEAKPA